MSVSPLHVQKFTIAVSINVAQRLVSCHMWNPCSVEPQRYSAAVPRTSIRSAFRGVGKRGGDTVHSLTCMSANIRFFNPLHPRVVMFRSGVITQVFITPDCEKSLRRWRPPCQEVFPGVGVQEFRDLSARCSIPLLLCRYLNSVRAKTNYPMLNLTFK